MRASLICLICSFWTIAAAAADTIFCGNFQQGEIIRGTTSSAQNINLNHKPFPVMDDGSFLLVFGRDENKHVNIQIDNGRQYALAIAPVKWDIQNIKGVPQRKVTPSKEDTDEILREQKDVRQALHTVDLNRHDWKNGFILPVEGRISGQFGNQRIFNDIPKSPHSGVDIAAPAGTPVKASASGKVLLSGGNYFYGGNMVILDHGLGLQTIYMHLQETKVKVGQEVEKGDIIGLVGSTGRSTGPHLHWGASLQNIRFRPHSLLGLATGECRKLEAEMK